MNAKMFEKRLLECVDKIGGVGKACEAAGITYTTLTRWKDGTSDPKMSNILAFAKAADVSLDWLIFGDTDTPSAPATDPNTSINVEQAIDTLKNLIQDNQPKLTEDETYLLQKFRTLSDNQKQVMIKFLIGGFDNLSNTIVNSPNAQINNRFGG